MAENHTVKVTLKIRNDLAANWDNNNPVLAQGEFGLENNTFLLKIGDGTTHWNKLPYLNKLDERYFIKSNGTITFDPAFETILNNVIVSREKENESDPTTIDGLVRIDYGTDSFDRPNIPEDNLAIVNKYYVDRAIALAEHLKKQIVTELPAANAADPNTIYMVLDSSVEGSDKYKEYMVIKDANNQSQMTQIGDTSIDLKNLVAGATPGHLVKVADDGSGSLVDAGVDATSAGALEIATTIQLGGVKSGTGAKNGDDRIVVDSETGFMTLGLVSTTLLYVPDGDTLILEGGNSGGGIISG